MTLDLQALKQLCAVATPGPWRYDERNDHGSPLIYAGEGRDEPVVAFKQATYDEEAWWLVSDPDAEFIAAAREYLPILIAEIERLRGVETAHERAHSCLDTAGAPEPDTLDAGDRVLLVAARADRLQALLNEATELLHLASARSCGVCGYGARAGHSVTCEVRTFLSRLKEGNPSEPVFVVEKIRTLDD